MAPFAYEFRGGADRDRGHAPNRDNNDKGRSRRRDGDRGLPQRPEFTFRFFKPTSERPLLSRRRETTPELLGAQQNGQDQSKLRFAQLDEITDSDEAEMDVSSSENSDGDSNPPRKKRAIQREPSAEAEQPKWSNPDPYTALPPPDETHAKRPDFVKLIRKARIADTAADPLAQGDAVTTNEDFISFGAEDGDFVDENAPPENAPTGPKVRQQGLEDVGAGKKRTRDDQVKVFTGKFGKVSFTPGGDIISVWRAQPSDNGSPWLGLMEPTMHLGTR